MERESIVGASIGGRNINVGQLKIKGASIYLLHNYDVIYHNVLDINENANLKIY